MRILTLSVLVSFAFVAVSCAAPQEESETVGEHQAEEFGLTLLYAGDRKPKTFLKETACVAGTSWVCTDETDTHYIGTLSYPTENTVDYRQPEARLPFVVNDVKIRKQEEMPIDLSVAQAAILLRDPDPETPLSMRGDGTVYELIGYVTDASDTSANFGFLFKQNPGLQYVAPEEGE